jgi:hypothetical protein
MQTYKECGGEIMRIKGAMTVLNKEAEFLGLTFDQLIIFAERNPYAMPEKTIEALKVYKNWKDK